MSRQLWDNSGVADPPGIGVFAGRDAELELLGAALDALDQAGTRTVLVGGDAGIGKSWLMERFGEHARGAGALVAVGVCTPAEGGGLVYGPVVGVLRDLTRQLDGPTAAAILGPARQGLGLIAPPQADPTPAAPPQADPTPAASPPIEMVKTRLFEALLSCLAALAERSRLVVVFEDLQWADSASVEVLDFLTRNLGDSPVLLIGTFRSDEIERDQSLDRMVAELGRHRAVSSIELAGLDREATAAIMAKSLGRRPEWALLEAVYARCEGNPFLAQELTAARDMTSLPSGLRRVVMLRVERLTAEARHVVNIAAAAGASIDHRLLVTVADDLDAQSVTLAVNEAVRRQVLTVDGRSHFRFRHALQREAVYEGLLPSERARLHRRIAIALRENPELGSFGPGQAIVELAGHWWHSEEWSEALPASIAAGEAAAALLAMPETYVHYGRALTACERLPEDLGRRAIDYVGLLLKAADAAYLTGAVQRSVELARAALGALDFDREPRRAAVAFTTLGRNALADGDGDGAFEAFHRAVELLSRDSPSVELAAATAEQARAHMLVSRFEDAATHCHDAIAIAQAVGARAEEGHALNTLGVCIAEQHGDFDAGIALLGRARAIAEEIGHPDDLNRAYANLTHVLMSAGRLEETARVVFDGIAQGERLVGVRLNGAGQNSAEALIRLGRWDEADDLLSRMDDHGVGSCVFGPQAVRAALAIRRGRFDIAAERLEAADTFSAGLASVQVRGWFHMLSAELALEKRQPTQASEDIERALNIAAGTDDNMYRPEMCALGVRALADEHDTALGSRPGGRQWQGPAAGDGTGRTSRAPRRPVAPGWSRRSDQRGSAAGHVPGRGIPPRRPGPGSVADRGGSVGGDTRALSRRLLPLARSRSGAGHPRWSFTGHRCPPRCLADICPHRRPSAPGPHRAPGAARSLQPCDRLTASVALAICCRRPWAHSTRS